MQSRTKYGLAAGAAVLAVLAAAPALGAGGQPPPDAKPVEIKAADIAPIPKQPPADAEPVKIKAADIAPIPKQPAGDGDD